MFVEKRKVGKRTKYYLVHSFRENGGVKKIRRFLGSDLSDSELNKIKKSAESIIIEQIRIYKTISDPLKTVLDKEEINELQTLESKGKMHIFHLSEDEWNKFSEDFTYDTNAIEGSTVTKNEVKNILRKNHWPEDRAKWEVSETYGVSDAIKYIRKSKTHISLELIKKLHFIVFKNSKQFAGNFRKTGEEVVVANSSGRILHRGAPSQKVTCLIKELVSWYEKNNNRYPPITLSAVVHNQFENIHPFLDGNGRVGRLLLNNILIKHSLPPVNIHFSNRQIYYSTLREYQKNGNIRPTIELILNEYGKLKKNR
ncbi:MAG: Fic family protein [Candidatus Aenigmarchaeota archaeon]|nr:Fic family protein [Candidatus Aenigmarchaeota archaeon]